MPHSVGPVNAQCCLQLLQPGQRSTLWLPAFIHGDSWWFSRKHVCHRVGASMTARLLHLGGQLDALTITVDTILRLCIQLRRCIQ